MSIRNINIKDTNIKDISITNSNIKNTNIKNMNINKISYSHIINTNISNCNILKIKMRIAGLIGLFIRGTNMNKRYAYLQNIENKDYMRAPLFFKSYDEAGNSFVEAYFSVNKNGVTVFQTAKVIEEKEYPRHFLKMDYKDLTDGYFQDKFENHIKILTSERAQFDIVDRYNIQSLEVAEDILYDFIKSVGVFGVYLKKKGRIKEYCNMTMCLKDEAILCVWSNLSWMPEELWKKCLRDYLRENDFGNVNRMFIGMYKASAGKY